jgi:hypothetical protein
MAAGVDVHHGPVEIRDQWPVRQALWPGRIRIAVPHKGEPGGTDTTRQVVDADSGFISQHRRSGESRLTAEYEWQLDAVAGAEAAV